MTPREALYHICVELGPPKTDRNDNLTQKEEVLRDAVRTLQNFILYHDSDQEIPESANEYNTNPRKGSGKDRIDKWKSDIKKS